MHFAFRADASLKIGTGHVIRCLTLADALRERGAQSRFICREHPGNLIDLIRQRGYVVHALPYDQYWEVQDERASHAAWLGADWKTDAEQTIVGTDRMVIDWLIVDHYALDQRWESLMRGYCRSLMVIDDLADRPHDCDLLLDQNLGRSAQDYAGLLNSDTSTLIGPQFALLRPEFAALRPKSLARRAQSPQFKHLLITMGGVDKDNATCQVLGALQNCALPADLHVTVVMGLHAPWLPQVQALAAKMPWPTAVLVSVNNMAQLMAESELCIGAAGSTSWERCCLGLPSLLLVLAANQMEAAKAIEVTKSAWILEKSDDLSKNMAILFEKLTVSTALLESSAAASCICDGSGINRLTDLLVNPE